VILTDNETKVDLLNNEPIAATIVTLLRKRPEQPVTVGVHGDWGAGKSSILEMIDASLAKDAKVLCLKFNGWRFQGFEDAKIALIEGIVAGLLEKRPSLTKAGDAVKAVAKRIDWLKVAKKAGGLAFTAFTGVPAPQLVDVLVSTLQGIAADPLKLATKENLEATVSGMMEVLKPGTESKSVPEEIEEFRKAFKKLLEAADIDQLVVLIDDLDRCLPDIAIETLEAIRLFVFTERTAFVVAADEAMIEYAVRKHFPDLPDTTGPQTYARSYLEKLIQVPFRIPALGETETRIYVTLLLAGSELGESAPEFNALIDVARAKLRRPWLGGALNSTEIKSALGAKAAKAQDALVLSEQVGPILASGTKGNPRQIKRFLNTLQLRKRSAQARGFGDDVNVPVLSKLMLAEQFFPRVFDQIAMAAAISSSGVCRDLAPLEAAARVPAERQEDQEAERSKKKSSARKTSDETDDSESGEAEPTKATEGALLTEWLSSPAVRAWAKIEPSLGDLDLRPYLFVTKDRKDYFGAASVLGHLGKVAEQLLGARFAVNAVEPELRRLAAPEAAQVFELLRGRIIGGDSFESAPAGIEGLKVLVRAHPALQDVLMDLLETLPAARLGPWACTGWDAVLKDASAQRFDRLLGRWESDGGKLLKAAAGAARRARQRS
jgi:hypothetical protein